MIIERVIYRAGDRDSYVLLRDPYERGAFLHGIECNERGIAVRQEGCTGSELWIRKASILERQPVESETA